MKIKIFAPKLEDGTAWWRLLSPFEDLYKTDKINAEFWDGSARGPIGKSDFLLCDVCVFQRPYSDTHLKAITTAKDLGKYIWIDYDDDLLDIPFSNPAFRAYSDPATKQRIGKIARLADIITTSTAELKRVFSPMNKNIIVIPNAIDLSICPPIKENKVAAKYITWRGSRTHDEDLIEFLPALKEISKEFEDWKFVFFGEPFWGVADAFPKKRAIIIESVPIPKYFHFLNDYNGEIGIVPLKDCRFNRSKSNIAYQEFTYSQSAVLCPDWEEWQQPGATTYKDTEDFYQKLKWLIQNPQERNRLKSQALDALQHNLNVRVQNTLRKAILFSDNLKTSIP